MFGSFGWMELLLVLIIVLIVFGAGKLPQIGEGVGKAIKGFKRSVSEAEAPDLPPQEDPSPNALPSQPPGSQEAEPAQRPDQRARTGPQDASS